MKTDRMGTHSFLFLILTHFLLLTHFLYAQDKIIHHYTVRISEDLQTLYVEACFGNIAFYHLYAGSNLSAANTKNIRLNNHFKTRKYSADNYELALHQNAANTTLYYEFDLGQVKNRSRWNSSGKNSQFLRIPPDRWLWRPLELEENEEIHVTFDFPKNVYYSVPWQKIGLHTHLIDRTPYNWPSAGAFGNLAIDTISVSGCKLAIAAPGGDYPLKRKDLLHWIKNAAASVTNLYGSFPVKNAQVIIIPIGQKNEPVPFGMAIRGGGFSLEFYIDPSRPVEEFIADWTATHELSHSLLPYINRGQMWLSEGMATYYQYILMGRDGRLTETEAWQRIYNGFQKGKDNSPGKSVKITAENMRNYHAYPFVYWTGAALMLKADVALRKNSHSRKSLDRVLKQIQDRHIPATRTWDGREMLVEMDRLAQTSIFMDLYKKYINVTHFPVDTTYWKELGVLISDGEVQLTADAPLAHIRRQIIRGQK